MKAIIRWGVGLFGLLLLTSVSHGYEWVSPVFKCPLPYAPDCCNPGFWAQGPHGMWYGPNYYLMPPCGPFNGMLPGPTGKALMTGGLPLMAGHKIAPPNAIDLQGPQPPQMPYGGTLNPLQGPQGPQGPQPGQLPYAGTMQGPQLPLGYGRPPLYQVPYQVNPPMPYPVPTPYPQPMPQPMPMQPNRPAMYMPYQGPMGVTYLPVRQDPTTGIWLVQGVTPNQGGAIRPIPNFNAPMPAPTGPMPPPMAQYYPMPMPPMGTPSAMPMMQGTPGMPGTPYMPGLPNMPATPGNPSNMPYTTYGPSNGFQFFMQPNDTNDKMSPLQGPQVPRMDFEPMQLPRMEGIAPPPVRVGGPFPTHPFVRGPRDFFMWGETMDQERARGSRPYPVP